MLQSKSCDKIAGYLFSVPALVVYSAGECIPGAIYFHICGVIDLLVVFLILKVKSNLSLALSKALFISILLNLFGFVAWYYYLQDGLYTTSFLMYYIFVAYLLLSRGQIDWNSLRQYWGSSDYSYAPGLG